MDFSFSVIVHLWVCVVWVRGMSQMATRLFTLPREKKLAALQECKFGLPRRRHNSGKAVRRAHETSSAAAGLGRLKGLPTTVDYCVKGIRKVIKCHNLYCEPRQSHIVNIVDLEMVSWARKSRLLPHSVFNSFCSSLLAFWRSFLPEDGAL